MKQAKRSGTGATTSTRSATKAGAKKAPVKKTPAKKPVKKAAVKKTAAKKVAKKVVRKVAVNAAKKTTKKAVKKTTKNAPATSAAKPAKPAKAAKTKKTVTAANATAKKAVAPKAGGKSSGKQSVKKTGKTATVKAAAKTIATTIVKTVAKAALKTARKPAPARRPKRFTAPETTRDFGFAPGAPDLPAVYGEDRLVLMTKDPEYLFAYWEITPERVTAAETAKRKGEEYREVLRLNWAARELFDANYALLPVSFEARRWYLRVPYSGISYQLELGWLGSQGHYVPLLQSNPSDAPEAWAATRKRLKSAGAAGPDGVLSRLLETSVPQGASQAPPKPASAEPVVRPDDFGKPGSGDSSFGTSGTSGSAPGRRPA